MKVLIVSNDTNLGGASLSMIDMIRELEKYADILVVLPAEGSVSEFLRKENISYYVVPFERDFTTVIDETKARKMWVSTYSAACTISKIIKEENISVVHTNSSVGNAGAIAAMMADVPHVWHVRELMEEDFGASYYDIEFKKRLFERSSIITISRITQKVFQEKYGIDNTFIYNGLETERYKGFHNSENRSNIILPGNITEGKGQWDAVEAMRLLRNDGFSGIKLILFSGDTRSAWEVQKYIQKHSLTDMISINTFSKDLSIARQECGCAFVTSKMEALGRVTIEAMLSQEFLIGANTGGTKELIGNNERGLLYKQGDPKSLAEAYKKFFAMSKNEEIQIKQKAFEFALIEFNAEEYANRIFGLYQKTCREYKHNNYTDILSLLENKCDDHTIQNDDSVYTNVKRKREQLMQIWDQLEEHNYSVCEFFKKNGFYEIGIYGMGVFGRRLYDELENSTIKVKMVSDQDPGHLNEICNYQPVDTIRDIDVLVSSVISSDEKEMIDWLEGKTGIKTIGIIGVLDSIMSDNHFLFE